MKAGVLTLLFLLLLTTIASAHAPIFSGSRDNPGVHRLSTIQDPERSWAVYGRLRPGRTSEVIPVAARQGQRLYVQVLVPERSDLPEFRPRVVLTGPGLPGGALTVPEPETPIRFYEPFTQMRFWIYGTVTGTYPAGGTYELTVTDPAGQGGPYVVAVGEREQFGVVDVLTFPLVWTRTHVWLWK